jgi:hypothetical protein
MAALFEYLTVFRIGALAESARESFGQATASLRYLSLNIDNHDRRQ